jgi:hypothetical protein
VKSATPKKSPTKKPGFADVCTCSAQPHLLTSDLSGTDPVRGRSMVNGRRRGPAFHTADQSRTTNHPSRSDHLVRHTPSHPLQAMRTIRTRVPTTRRVPRAIHAGRDRCESQDCWKV